MTLKKVEKGIIDKVTFQRIGGGEVTEETANAKALRQDHTWHGQETAKRPMWLEQSTHRGAAGDGIREVMGGQTA